jgi:hypothetical protein
MARPRARKGPERDARGCEQMDPQRSPRVRHGLRSGDFQSKARAAHLIRRSLWRIARGTAALRGRLPERPEDVWSGPLEALHLRVPNRTRSGAHTAAAAAPHCDWSCTAPGWRPSAASRTRVLGWQRERGRAGPLLCRPRTSGPSGGTGWSGRGEGSVRRCSHTKTARIRELVNRTGRVGTW